MRETIYTIVDFYEGAYGPTIRIDVQDYEWLRFFKTAITQLSGRITSEFDLLAFQNVEKAKISGFRIVMGESLELSIDPHVHYGTYPSFLWTLDAECARYLDAALDRLLEENQSGHYYLYEDDMIIELSYKE